MERKGKEQAGREISPIRLSLQHLFFKQEKLHLVLCEMHLKGAICKNQFFQYGPY